MKCVTTSPQESTMVSTLAMDVVDSLRGASVENVNIHAELSAQEKENVSLIKSTETNAVLVV